MAPVQYGGQVRHCPNRATEHTGMTVRRGVSPSRNQSRRRHVRLTDVCAVEERGIEQRGIKHLSQKHMENTGDKNETKTLISGECLNRSGPSPHGGAPRVNGYNKRGIHKGVLGALVTFTGMTA